MGDRREEGEGSPRATHQTILPHPPEQPFFRGRDSGNGKVHRDGLEILGESGTLGDPEGQGHGGT